MNDRTGEIRSTLFPALREDQIETLSRYGQTRETTAGQVLFRAGDTQNDFFVVLGGEVEVVDDFGGEVRTMGSFARAVSWATCTCSPGRGYPSRPWCARAGSC
jgi:thioredoxin reductase (NADPH)